LYSKDYYPLTATFLVITLAVFNLAVLFWPNVFYPTHTLYNMANVNKGSLQLVFILMVVMLPIILSYTIFVYYTFKGKVSLQNKNNFYA